MEYIAFHDKDLQQGSLFDSLRPVTTKASPQTALAGKLRSLADSMRPGIDGKLAPMTQNPTPKRMRQYSQRVHEGNNLLAAQATLYALAEMHEQGTVPAILSDIKTKKEVLELMSTVGISDSYYEYHDTGKFIDDSPRGKALQELMSGTSEEQAAYQRRLEIDRREAEAKLAIGQIPGFFPTPRAIAERMVQEAHIEPGMSVLEPSAGNGALADVICELCPQAHVAVCELNYKLRELLSLKGYYVIQESDFLNYFVTNNGVNGWYRILMNPPFEKLADIDHVRHAYDCLKAGGRVVSIMSESTFFNSQKKAAEFREWLEEVGGWSVELPADAFRESGTTVKARIVVADK